MFPCPQITTTKAPSASLPLVVYFARLCSKILNNHSSRPQNGVIEWQAPATETCSTRSACRSAGRYVHWNRNFWVQEGGSNSGSDDRGCAAVVQIAAPDTWRRSRQERSSLGSWEQACAVVPSPALCSFQFATSFRIPNHVAGIIHGTVVGKFLSKPLGCLDLVKLCRGARSMRRVSSKLLQSPADPWASCSYPPSRFHSFESTKL